jgi:hypothetical protein
MERYDRYEEMTWDEWITVALVASLLGYCLDDYWYAWGILDLSLLFGCDGSMVEVLEWFLLCLASFRLSLPASGAELHSIVNRYASNAC